MRLLRTAIIATGFILPSFALGMIVATQPAPHAKTQQHISLSSTMSKTQAEPTRSTSTTTSTTTSAPSNQLIRLRKTNTPHTSTLATPATPATAATPPTPPTPQNNSTPIIAVSAVLSNWTQPQPTDSKFGLGCLGTSQCPGGYTAYPTFVQYRYCTWTYNDSSTHQKLYEDWYWSPNTSMQIIPEPLFDCTIANAPPA